jgi:uncharacterized protein
MKNLEIAGYSVAPGTSCRGEIKTLELADGAQMAIPLILVNGVRPGPRLYVGAGIHGDEVNSIALVARALSQIEASNLSGSIVCVPVQHPLAFQADHRLPLAQFLKSPLDQVPADAWTCFPGSETGNVAQIVAATLFGLIKQCDYALDVHTPTRGGRYVPIAILPNRKLELFAEAERLAHGLGSGWIMRGDAGMYVSDGILCVEATKAGVPCFTFEIGEGGRLEEEFVAFGAQCVLNVLKHLEMLDGKPIKPEQAHVMRDFLGIRANKGGLLITDGVLGQAVKKGDVIGQIVNVFGDVVEKVIAPQDGLLVRTTTLGSVSRGERVATLGLL